MESNFFLKDLVETKLHRPKTDFLFQKMLKTNNFFLGKSVTNDFFPKKDLGPPRQSNGAPLTITRLHTDILDLQSDVADIYIVTTYT